MAGGSVIAGTELWVSRQLLREYLAFLTRLQTWGNPQPMAILGAEVRRFERRFQVAEDGPVVTAGLLTLLQQIPAGGRQNHDANIVATMLAHGSPRLLTDNDTDLARNAGTITVMPRRVRR